MPNRRQFLKTAASAAPFAAALPSLAAGRHLKNIGVQLYTVRSIIDDNPAAVLKAIEEDGYTEVEAIYASMPKIETALKATRLKPVSMHIDMALFADESKMKEALDKAKGWGFQYAVYPYVPEPQRGEDSLKGIVEQLNRAGEYGKKLGLKVCYHNHAFEFNPAGGKRPLDILLGGTQKDLVFFEADLFWVSVAGQDPVAFLKEHAGRVVLAHMKDKAKGFPVQYNERVPKDTFKEVGNGSLDFAAILKTAASTGVQHYFVEQDQTPGDPLASLKTSYDYLHKLSF